MCVWGLYVCVWCKWCVCVCVLCVICVRTCVCVYMCILRVTKGTGCSPPAWLRAGAHLHCNDPHSRVATMHAPSCPRSTLLPTLSNKEPCRVQSCHGSNAHGASFKHTVSSRDSALKQTCYTALTSCCHLPFLQTAYLNKN